MTTLIKITGLQGSTAQSQTLSVSRGFRVPTSGGGADTSIRPGQISQVDIDDPQTRKRLGRQFDRWIEVPGNDLTQVTLRSLLIPSPGDVSQSLISRGVFIPTEPYGFVGSSTGAAKATLTTALAGANNDIKYTAVTPGTGGNAITVAYVDPGGATATLGVVVTGNAIVVNLGRAASAINSTATLVLAAIQGSAPAAALVDSALAAGNDGTGLVTALSATNLAGGAATGGPALEYDLNTSAAVTVDLTNPNVRRAVRTHIGRWVVGNASDSLVTIRGLVTSKGAYGGGITARGFRIAKYRAVGGAGSNTVAEVSPATSVQVDVSDWNVRRTLRRNVGRWVVVSSP